MHMAKKKRDLFLLTPCRTKRSNEIHLYGIERLSFSMNGLKVKNVKNITHSCAGLHS